MFLSCGKDYLNEGELLEVVTRYSPKKFHELKVRVDHYPKKEYFLKDLGPIFKSWANRQSQHSLSLIMVNPFGLKVKNENIEVIENFKRLGVIKRFEIVKYDF